MDKIVGYIKHNKIIFSIIQIIMIIVMIFFLVTQIQVKKQDSSGATSQKLDYTLVYNAAMGTFHKDTVSGTPLTDEEREDIGISHDIVEGKPTVTLNNLNITSNKVVVFQIEGKVLASKIFNGLLSTVVDINTKYADYKQVKIELTGGSTGGNTGGSTGGNAGGNTGGNTEGSSIITVDIIWGDMDFRYTEYDWNVDTLDYNNKIWSLNTIYGDTIKIINRGNIPIKTNIVCNMEEGYKDISASILEYKKPKYVFKKDTLVGPRDSIEAYLSLTGRLARNVRQQIIGNVTVSITY